MSENLCPQCHNALDRDGTCAICMLAGGFITELNSGAGVIDPGLDTTLEYDSFSPYLIRRVLGEGGMGTVYLAEQTQPLRRQVALKVLKLGLDSTEILSRFNYERHALAQMEHPNIARAYAAGASEKKRPYFVMEYVDGVAVTEYCDLKHLDIRARLELFVPVCQAVQHAHQKGVIHRDIKPSNVMVTEVDGQPVPKVIDFGIARAIDPRSSESGFTHLGQFIGTAEYMSPEQADLVTGDVDASSDVYSLGILLYELLAGVVPFDATQLRKAGPVELLRIIREEQAAPMTARLARMSDQGIELAARRHTDAIKLRQAVSGDLNWIVMKAIAKDRRLRYATAAELAADIRRHLDDQPVEASPPSATYRMGKFVRRHRLSVVAAAAVIAALVSGLVAVSWEAAIARRERTEALRQRSEAIAARTLAEQRSREAESERVRAEEQSTLAVRQRNLAETRLDDVHSLAVAMLFEINDDVKNLAGGTKARETLVRLGQQYLSKQETAQPDSVHRQELGLAFLKLGDLQGGPGSNLRDLQGARESYQRSTAILEKEVAQRPQDAASASFDAFLCA